MIFDFISLLALYFSIIGFSAETKKFVFNNKTVNIYNLDFFYGILILSFLGIILNFFLPLKLFSLPVLVLGLFFFYKNFKIKLYKINFISLLIILFITVFIFKSNGLAYDSALYHLQTIKWIADFKISLGLSNLEPRFGLNSLWHIFISLLNIEFKNIKFVYLFNYLPLIILINEFFETKNSFLANLFLFFSISFILTFAILHPFNNGVMLNLIGSPEVDTIAMIGFILTLYLFLKFILEYKDEYAKLILIISCITLLVKISHLSVVFFAIIVFFSQRKILVLTRLNFTLVLLSFFWLIRSLILSGCLIFPAASTCIKNLYWGHPINNVIFNAQSWTSFSRDTRLRLKAGDFDHTIHSFNWVKPWINDYLLNTSFFKAMFATFILSLLIIILKKIFNKKNLYISKKIYFLIPIYLFSFYIWFKNPEIRLGYGPLITVSTISLTLALYFNEFKSFFYKYSKLIVIILMFGLTFKNIDNISLINKNKDKYSKNYSNIKVINNLNYEKIFSPIDNEFCFDFKNICVIEKDYKYKIEKYFGYYLFLRN